MTTGKIKHLSARYFLFIAQDAGGEDLFAHAKNCATPFEELRVGQPVQFEKGYDEDRQKSFAFAVEAM